MEHPEIQWGGNLLPDEDSSMRLWSSWSTEENSFETQKIEDRQLPQFRLSSCQGSQSTGLLHTGQPMEEGCKTYQGSEPCQGCQKNTEHQS